MLENFRQFLQSREIINVGEEIPEVHQDTKYLRELIKLELKLVQSFEKKMTEDKKFNKFIFSPLAIKRDIEILEKTPDDGEGQIGVIGDMGKRYKAIVDMIKCYL